MKAVIVMLGFNISFALCLFVAFGIPFISEWDSAGILWDSWQQSDVIARFLGALGVAVLLTMLSIGIMELDI